MKQLQFSQLVNLSLSMDIQFICECDIQGLDIDILHALAETVLVAECTENNVRVTILLTGDEVLQELNLRFFGDDKPTDVLAFPDTFMEGEVDFPDFPEETRLLGEVAISIPSAARKAILTKVSLLDEVSHLLTHGCLHLCGFDHENLGEAEDMQRKEENYLDNPRLHT